MREVRGLEFLGELADQRDDLGLPAVPRGVLVLPGTMDLPMDVYWTSSVPATGRGFQRPRMAISTWS